ncbi:UvrD-helicase domain-containing protein [Neobacillus drentensis]|uniref:UvrD-helicase domain-containing protein n=1 Tax=Neobacillus drentensis TaxID=220684 RepID=UPI002FFDD519
MSGKLKMLSAGAGAGKTYSLTEEIYKSIKSGVPPENIMATTFTTKAADELIERVRLKLLEAGDASAAARILDGYVGTMNSVFGRLLREFALEMGLSPVQKVLADKEAKTLFSTIAAEVIEKFYRDFRLVFIRLGINDPSDKSGNYWGNQVLEVLKLARENGMSAADVQSCADFSWEIMSAWLPESLNNPDQLDAGLKSSLIAAKKELPGGDTTKKTLDAAETIQLALADWERHGAVTWQQWAKLSKLDSGKKSRDTISPVQAAASVHDCHPRLHQDLKDAMNAVFHCAAEAMETYAIEKRKRGLIDFTDQESLALKLIKDEQNIEGLKDRISAVFIDEFQDSSPLQIALNMQLREIAESATWVGDVKQAVYGFRGTDPELMQTAMTSIPDLEIEILDASYRSRKSLVEFVNKIFVPVFEARGMMAERITLDPKREDRPEQTLAVEAWSYLNSKNKKTDAAHLARGVQTVLRNQEQYIIVDKMTREPRSLRAGDIAILCRSNDECVEIAEYLAKVGITATVGEVGLLSAPEVVYAVAALRYLIDPRDSLALAELLHFSSDTWGEGRWLSEWLQSDKRFETFGTEPFIQELNKAREKIVQMSPSEVLDLALVTAKVDETALKWGQPNQRLANLDGLRKLAAVYEESAATNGTAATTTGFLLFLSESEKDKDLNQVAESTDQNAVRVLTYHKAKGLEWPFVILNSLDKSSKRKKLPVFDKVTAVSTSKFDVENPLNGRKLYYWPWPYGQQSSNVSLDAHCEDASQLQEREQQLLDENQRLMYVGMTRARDYLVLAARDFSKAGWLQELTDTKGRQVIASIGVAEGTQDDVPHNNRIGSMMINGEHLPCKVRVLSLEEQEEFSMVHESSLVHVFVGKTEVAAPFVPARFSPSGLKGDEVIDVDDKGLFSPAETETDVTKIHRIGSRLPLSGNPDMALLGDMVHAFLAADIRTNTKEERLNMAGAIRHRYDIHALTEASMVDASERLALFITEQYPDLVSTHHEWPIHLRKGLQKASGWIDLLLDTPKGWVIIDHKSFPGKEADWLKRGTSYLPQLRAYAEALSKATGRPVYEAWIHMPVIGAMIHFTEDDLRFFIPDSGILP